MSEVSFSSIDTSESLPSINEIASKVLQQPYDLHTLSKLSSISMYPDIDPQIKHDAILRIIDISKQAHLVAPSTDMLFKLVPRRSIAIETRTLIAQRILELSQIKRLEIVSLRSLHFISRSSDFDASIKQAALDRFNSIQSTQ